MQRALLSVSLILALATGVWATLAGQPSQSSQGTKVTLEDIAWLEGTWKGEMFEQRAEETWSSAEKGAMMGMFRLLGDQKTSVFEFMLLEETPQGLDLRFVHIGPGYEIWEEDGAPLVFSLSSADSKVFTFESPDPAQSPNRILYTLPDQGQMIVTVETMRDGKAKDAFDVVYSRE